MPNTTIFLIALAALIALGFVFFKYFVGSKNPGRATYILAVLRFFTIFILLLLLINPEITKRELEVEKPSLFLAVDQSASIDYIEKTDSVRLLTQLLQNNQALREKFDIKTYGFGNDLKRIENGQLTFTGQQTDISLALRNTEKLNRQKRTAMVLITDGNQTRGVDYNYYTAEENIGLFPVVVGDTTAQTDLYISNLNVNKYAFLNNDFPVEVIVNYSGSENVESKFEIRSGNNVLFSKLIHFNSESTSSIVTITLPATGLGARIYEAVIVPIPSEKNAVNNSRKFGVEVIDERTSVLILTAIPHPDIGALKKSIESNEQREVKIEYINNVSNINTSDFQLIILYQPNSSFNSIFSEIKERNQNYFLITGTQTDWNLINSAQDEFSKDFTSQDQEIFAVYNSNYSTFQFDDIDFSGFPPLEDKFGTINFETSLNPLLFQRLEGIQVSSPLLATMETPSSRRGVLFGQNIWKWRSLDYIDAGSFENFDNFIGKLIQYLSGNVKKDRLTIDAETVFLENENIVITAQFFDENYVFDPQGNIEIFLTRSESENTIESSMLLSKNRYIFEAENLEPGEYSFEVKEIKSGISRTGNFIILEYNIEQQSSSANIAGMKNLANSNSTSLYFLNQPEELINKLIEDDSYVSVQKSREKTVPLINFKMLLALLLLTLSAEWFTRKYFGLI